MTGPRLHFVPRGSNIMIWSDSADARERYFEGPASIGDAMLHARGANPGACGGDQALQHDCARILQHEIRCCVPHVVLPSVEEILSTETFQSAYRGARGGREEERVFSLASFARSMGNDWIAKAAESHLERTRSTADEASSARSSRSLPYRVLHELQQIRERERDRAGRRPWGAA